MLILNASKKIIIRFTLISATTIFTQLNWTQQNNIHRWWKMKRNIMMMLSANTSMLEEERGYSFICLLFKYRKFSIQPPLKDPPLKIPIMKTYI